MDANTRGRRGGAARSEEEDESPAISRSALHDALSRPYDDDDHSAVVPNKSDDSVQHARRTRSSRGGRGDKDDDDAGNDGERGFLPVHSTHRNEYYAPHSDHRGADDDDNHGDDAFHTSYTAGGGGGGGDEHHTHLTTASVLTHLAEGAHHTVHHWRVLLFGQCLSFLLASTGAASATLHLECNLSAPTAQSGLMYFLLSLHGLCLWGWCNRNCDPRPLEPLEDESLVGSATATSGGGRGGNDSFHSSMSSVQRGGRARGGRGGGGEGSFATFRSGGRRRRNRRGGGGGGGSRGSHGGDDNRSLDTISITDTLDAWRQLGDHGVDIDDEDEDDDIDDDAGDDVGGGRRRGGMRRSASRRGSRGSDDDLSDDGVVVMQPSGDSSIVAGGDNAKAPHFLLCCCRMFPLHAPWYAYAIIAFLDVEANYLTFLSFRYTTFMSITLFDSLAIPSAMLFSRALLGRKYKAVHLLGAAVCMVGVVVNVLSDFEVVQEQEMEEAAAEAAGTTTTGEPDDDEFGDRDEYPLRLAGDLLAISGGLLYGLNDVLVEMAVRNFGGPDELLTMLGLFGTIISAIQVWILEKDDIAKFFHGEDSPSHDGTATVGGDVDDGASECNTSSGLLLLFAYVLCNYLAYVGTARFLSLSEAALLNLSLLTGDLWAVVFSVFAERIVPRPLFWLALTLIVCGVFVYEIGPSPIVDANDKHPLDVKIRHDEGLFHANDDDRGDDDDNDDGWGEDVHSHLELTERAKSRNDFERFTIA